MWKHKTYLDLQIKNYGSVDFTLIYTKWKIEGCRDIESSNVRENTSCLDPKIKNYSSVDFTLT